MKKNESEDVSLALIRKPEFLPNSEVVGVNYSELKRLWSYYLRLLTVRFRNSYDEKKIIRYASLILNLLNEADLRKLVALNDLKNEKDVRNFLQEVSGLSGLKQWLRERPAEKIISASGKKDVLVDLWDLKLSSFTAKAFESLDNLKKEVDDLSTWFKLVFFFLDRNLLNLTTPESANCFVNVLEIHKVFINFLVSLTLELEKSRFSIDEYYLFLRRMDNFNLWLTDINNKINGFEPGSCAIDVMEHHEMRAIIENFKSKHRRLIFLTEIKSLLVQPDLVLVDKLETELAAAANFMVFCRLDDFRKASDVRQKELIAKIEKFLLSHKINDVYNWLLTEHRFLPWLSEDFLKALIVYDRFRGQKLIRKYSEIDLSGYEELSPISLLNFFQTVAKVEQPFELNWSILKRVGHNRISSKEINEAIFAMVFRGVEICRFNSWLSVMIIRDEPLKGIIPSHFFLATYLDDSSDSKKFKELRKASLEFLENKPWFRYLDDECTRSYFNNETRRIIAEKMKNIKKSE
jgi:hypothetical protein